MQRKIFQIYGIAVIDLFIDFGKFGEHKKTSRLSKKDLKKEQDAADIIKQYEDIIRNNKVEFLNNSKRRKSPLNL